MLEIKTPSCYNITWGESVAGTLCCWHCIHHHDAKINQAYHNLLMYILLRVTYHRPCMRQNTSAPFLQRTVVSQNVAHILTRGRNNNVNKFNLRINLLKLSIHKYIMHNKSTNSV